MEAEEAFMGLRGERLTLEQKVGQLFMVGFDGPSPTEFAREAIEKWGVGGIILFARNYRDPRQLAALNAEMQELAAKSEACAGIPLFICTDQEGGAVVRLTGAATVLPGNMALGATGDAGLAYEAGRVTAAELSATGVNMDLAPVLDVNNNADNPIIGVRSFGEDPALVARLGVAFARGLQDGGVLATGKHFPGHGDTAVDSHLALPAVMHERRRLEEVELRPFREAVAAGIGAVMSAHITFPAIDPVAGRPATLSPPVLTGLLREKMGFGGLIVTDSMEMKAIADNFGAGPAAVMALEAGADCVLISHTPEVQRRSIEAAIEAVRSGRLSLRRVDESVKRVLAAKERFAGGQEGLGDGHGRPRGEGPAAVGSPEHRAVARAIARRSVTIVQNRGGVLPIAAGAVTPAHPGLVVEFHSGALSIAEDRIIQAGSLAEALARAMGQQRSLRGVALPMDPEDADIAQVARLAEDAAWIVVATQKADAFRGQAALVRRLAAGVTAGVTGSAGVSGAAGTPAGAVGAPLVVVALRTPYDLRAFPEIPAFVAAYSFREDSLEAAADAILGLAGTTGKLPVSIPGLYQAGHGLTLKESAGAARTSGAGNGEGDVS